MRADGFADILKDGRGITFGRAGFTTATGDGLWVLMRYQELKPENNSLRQYVPEFLRIQYLRKGINATLTDAVGGWGAAAVAVAVAGRMPIVARQQRCCSPLCCSAGPPAPPLCTAPAADRWRCLHALPCPARAPQAAMALAANVTSMTVIDFGVRAPF